ncbi:MAG: glutamate--tRNA ligase [Candidatus Limnocylindria bacterium]
MSEVRVRFAPSPTGSLHIGSVRTILYNLFFARRRGGALVLRIEDTDRERFVPGALDSIYDGLAWVGVVPDEGPREGGAHAPYVQSERLALYQDHARQLVAAGAAYHCFCSRERLEDVRRAQQARGEITRYDRHCRALDPREGAERAAREPHVVRLKVPDEGEIAIDDLVYGRREWPLRAIEDQVLLKSDGFPTYHLAVVVDDHLMRISHVFRAEDWLPSTPKHLLLYRAFGWDVPPHAHLPNVLGPDGRKLSKRHGATAVGDFRAQGYLPEALVNFLALIGWAPGTEEEVFSVEELVARWRIDHVQRAGGRWDAKRLDYFNALWIRRLSPDALAERLRPFVPAEWDGRLLRAGVPLIQERMTTLVEARALIEFLFVDEVAPDRALLVPKKRDAGETIEALAKTTVHLRYAEPFSATTVEHGMKAVAGEVGWTQSDLNKTVRAAVTGRTVGPPLYESMALLGRDRSLRRIESAAELLGA